jgi:hypothetical protein
MKWFRKHIKTGSRLALFALAIQFALSFGHFHGAAAHAAPAIQSDAALSEFSDVNALAASHAVGDLVQQQPDSDHDSGRHPGDPCAICTVISLANSILFATPPLLLLPQAIELLHLATGAEFTHLNAVSAAFQSRAPPIS